MLSTMSQPDPTDPPPAETTPTDAPARPRIWPYLLAALLPVIYLAALRADSLRVGENSTDAYYHVGLGEQFPAAGFWRTMPTTTLSVWHEHFYDKEWGFHFYLGLSQRLAKALGAGGPPFHGSSAAVLVLFIGAMAGALYVWRVRAPWLVTGGMLVCTVEMVHRLLMVRPHLFGMTLLIVATVVFSRTTRRRWW